MNYMEITLPNYSYVFNFEEEFEHQGTRVWMIENWTICFYLSFFYMILIFGGQHYMQSRPPFQLRGILSIWNTCLATFSIVGACRTAPELFHVLKNFGIYHSVCVPRYVPTLSSLSLILLNYLSTEASIYESYFPIKEDFVTQIDNQ